MSSEFSIIVRKAMIDRNMKHHELARKINASPVYLSHILHGRRNAGKYEVPIRAALGLKNERIDTAMVKAFRSE